MHLHILWSVYHTFHLISYTFQFTVSSSATLVFFCVIQLASKKAENKQKTLMEKLQEIDVNYGEICAEAENEAKSHKKQHGGGKGGGKGSGRKHKRKGTISSPINLTSDPDLKLCHLVSWYCHPTSYNKYNSLYMVCNTGCLGHEKRTRLLFVCLFVWFTPGLLTYWTNLMSSSDMCGNRLALFRWGSWPKSDVLFA